MLCKKPYWKQKAHRILKLGTAILDNEILTVQPYNHRTTKIEKKKLLRYTMEEYK